MYLLLNKLIELNWIEICFPDSDYQGMCLYLKHLMNYNSKYAVLIGCLVCNIILSPKGDKTNQAYTTYILKCLFTFWHLPFVVGMKGNAQHFDIGLALYIPDTFIIEHLPSMWLLDTEIAFCIWNFCCHFQVCTIWLCIFSVFSWCELL